MDSEHVRGSETLHKSARQYFCHIFWSLWNKMSLKKSFLVVSEILRLFVKILAPNDNHSLSVKASVKHSQFKCNDLKIKKSFLNFFFICKIYIKLAILWKKKKSWTLFLFEIIDCQKRGYLNAKKPRFRILIDSEYVKGSETLPKSPR